MRTNLIGILGVIIFFSFVNNVNAQPFTPELYVDGSAFVSSPPYSHQVDLKLDYQSSGLPNSAPFTPHNQYQPLEVFWEFRYKNYFPTGKDLVEYSFQKAPSCTFRTNFTDVEVTAHTIDDYDKDEEPPTEHASTNLTYSPPSADQPRGIAGSSIEILPSWAPSPEDYVIYIVRLEVGCDGASSLNETLSFTFDNSKADFLSSQPASTTPSGGVVTWGFTGQDLVEDDPTRPEERYRDFYVKLRMKDEGAAPVGEPFICNATLGVGGGRCNVPDAEESAETVRNSHDPNEKWEVNPQIICADSDGEDIRIRYKIEFQNIGEGGAYDVSILDWLDEKEQIKKIIFVNSKDTIHHSRTSFDNLGVHPDPQSGFVYWHFKYDTTGFGLRGTEETMYMIDFNEPATKSWLLFDVYYHKDVLGACNALMNHARITFDCNPEFYTPTVMTDMCCDVGNDTCTIQQDEFFTILSEDIDTIAGTNNQFQLTPSLQAYLNTTYGNNAHINWYPDRWIDNGNQLNARLRPLEDIEYTLVISEQDGGNCGRSIFRIFINVDDHNREKLAPIAVLDDNDQGDCTSTPIVIGGSPKIVNGIPTYDYLWENLSTGTSLTLSPGQSRTCSLKVTDAHGCTATFETHITCPWSRTIYYVLFATFVLLLFLVGRYFIKRKG